jgi:hypothetical protein
MEKLVYLRDFEYAWHMTYPECNSDLWFIVIDGPESMDEQAAQIQCAECGYRLGIQNDR